MRFKFASTITPTALEVFVSLTGYFSKMLQNSLNTIQRLFGAKTNAEKRKKRTITLNSRGGNEAQGRRWGGGGGKEGGIDSIELLRGC